MQSKLIEIPFEKWAQLRDLYLHQKDRSSCYNTIQIFIDWYEQDSNVPLKIYAPNDKWVTDGTYVAHLILGNHLYCNTLNKDFSGLLEAMKCFDNSKTVAGFQERILPAVEKFFIDSGLSSQQFLSVGTTWVRISREDALKFDTELPENITVRELDETHAEQVNAVWPHRSEGSVNLVRHLIKYNNSVGLFEGDKLVAWCLIVALGALGLLQVEETHKRRGLGKLATKIMAKHLAQKGVEVTAAIVFENSPSLCMFKQLGFKAIDNVYWSFKV
ncbi:uncharacterized protein LOC106092042 [Stomoxys calcitrans]|uniref:uncharacterized protein LOC106092042 n=1 Tax=Stomoxys calcitrans TaxID=35570 RepID=UPI0027E2A793|nr:uncharacterized protein LOC106092042 [Stomoxys calcitrans]